MMTTKNIMMKMIKKKTMMKQTEKVMMIDFWPSMAAFLQLQDDHVVDVDDVDHDEKFNDDGGNRIGSCPGPNELDSNVQSIL